MDVPRKSYVARTLHRVFPADRQPRRRRAPAPSTASIRTTSSIRIMPTMTVFNGINVIVGSVIGSGIFVAPTAVVQHVGSYNAALVVWVSCGVYSMFGAYCFTELGCMIRRSGGDYVYVRETFGPFIGFIRLWIELIITRPGATAIIALTFGFYSAKPFFPECDPPDAVIKLNAITAVLLLTFFNCWSIKWSICIQDVVSYGKLVALGIVIAAGIYQLSHGKVEYFTWDNTNGDFQAWALSYYGGLFAYNNWNYLNAIVNEMINPVRDLPIAIGVALLLTTFVNTFINVAFYTSLSVDEFLKSVCVADSFAQVVFGKWAWVMSFFVSFSTFGAINGKILTSSRLFYAAALNQEMPHLLGTIQIERLLPLPAVLAFTFVVLIYMCIPSTYIFSMINYAGFANWLGIGFTVFCVIVLRFKKPDLDRPIKVNLFFPVTYVLATLIIVTVPVVKSPQDTGLGLLMVLTGIPVYYVFVKTKTKPMWVYHAWNFIERLIPKIFVCSDEEDEDDL